MPATRTRRGVPVARGAGRVVPVTLAALVAVLVVLVGASGAAALAAEAPPNPKACRYNNPAIKTLTAQQAAAPTVPEQLLHLSEAQQFSRGDGVVVAVVDSGVDANHEQLAGHVAEGWDLTSGKPVKGARTDCAGHGTAVAGLIVAQPSPGRAFVGVAPEASILPVRESWGVDDNGRDTQSSADTLIRAIRVAVTSGAKVVNVSVTVPDVQLRQSQRDAFNEVAQEASDRDVLIVAASGNRSQYSDLAGQQFTTYPAVLATWYRNVVAVSGVKPDRTADDDAITGSFITVAAPDRDFPTSFTHGGLVYVGHGTSYAAPLVSGVAALIRSRYPALSAAAVRDRIEQTADHPSTRLPDPQVGFGIIDPVAALTAVLVPPRPQPSPKPAALGVVTPYQPAFKDVALWTAGSAVLLTGLLVFGVDVLQRSRRRRAGIGLSPARPPASRSAVRSGSGGRPGG